VRHRVRDNPPRLTHTPRLARPAPPPYLQDWHPPDHASFASNNEGAALFSMVELEGIGPQIMWPNHCVQASLRARARAYTHDTHTHAHTHTHTHTHTRPRFFGPPDAGCAANASSAAAASVPPPFNPLSLYSALSSPRTAPPRNALHRIAPHRNCTTLQNSRGAEFHPELVRDEQRDVVVQKGTHRATDSYSGFGDASATKSFEQTHLQAALNAAGATDVVVLGLATDFCVSFTCKDAAACGFRTWCVLDGSRHIAADSLAAEIAAMRAAGCHIVTSADVAEIVAAPTSAAAGELAQRLDARDTAAISK
jgi:hypothetical protein